MGQGTSVSLPRLAAAGWKVLRLRYTPLRMTAPGWLPLSHNPQPMSPPPRTPIPLVAAGADWLVVSKPAGLLVHPTRPDGTFTLLDALRGLLAYEIANGGQASLIHRLDRETSGAMLVATTAAAARRFSLDMMGGRIGKEYLALVRGWPEWDARIVDAPLLRQSERAPSRIWLKRTIHPDGAPARTRLAVARRFERGGERFALVRAYPETGRIHQIRVHLAHAGHPVVGDKIYGPDEGCYLEFIETGWTPALARVLLMERHALHAHRLTFDGRTVEAPCPPTWRRSSGTRRFFPVQRRVHGRCHRRFVQPPAQERIHARRTRRRVGQQRGIMHRQHLPARTARQPAFHPFQLVGEQLAQLRVGHRRRRAAQPGEHRALAGDDLLHGTAHHHHPERPGLVRQFGQQQVDDLHRLAPRLR